MATTTEWCICEDAVPDQPAAERLGNAFLLGNGYMGYRGTLEEYTKEQKTATIVSGLYDKVGSLWREPVNLPNGCRVQVFHDGRLLDAMTAPVRAHIHTLDMRRAVVSRCTTFVLPGGNLVTLRAERFVSLASLHLISLRYSVETARDCDVLIRTAVDGDVWDLNGPHLRDFRGGGDREVATLQASCTESGMLVAVSELTRGTESWTPAFEKDEVVREAHVTLRVNRPFVLDRFVSVYTGIDCADPVAAGRVECERAAGVGFERLLAEHVSRWEERWRSVDVVIHGDDAAQRALRFSTYHILSVATAHSDRVSIPARGLSSQVYKGAVFWDTEIFMLPFFVATMPEIARNLLMYRYRTLDGARRKAREYDRRGAFYAWESQDTGDDACTLFNVTDVLTGRPMRTYFRDKQYHISADIVYAMWQYYRVTGDISLFLDGGAEVVFECARFYLSLLYYSPARDRYEILDVTGPDEYHERVHNNAFTNAMVAHAFDVSCRLYDILSADHPEELRALVEKLDFELDRATILEARKKLYIPPADPVSSLVPQFDGYFALDDVPLDTLKSRRQRPNEYLGGGNGLATNTQIIKQADVVLGLHLVEGVLPVGVKEPNWRYYESRTEHGSSLSAYAYAVVGAEIGELDRAYEYFMETATIDLNGRSKQYVGTLYIDGTHAAANAAAWGIVVSGFCGIRFRDDVLSVDPHLPPRWKEVVVPIVYRGQELRVRVRHDLVEVTPTTALSARIRVELLGRTHELPAAGTVYRIPS